MALTFGSLVVVVTLAPVLAGLPLVLGRNVGEGSLHTLLGLAAGLMIGVAFLEIIPETLAFEGSGAELTLGITFVALYLFEGLIGVHGHSAHEEAHSHEPGDHFDRPARTPLLALGALSVHMFLDGLILAPAFAVNEALGVPTGVADAAHKVPGGFAAGTILVAMRTSTTRGVLGILAVASTTALGALTGVFLVDVSGLVPHLLGVAGGALLFVAVAELLPELHHGPHKRLVALGLALGFAAVVVAVSFLGHLGAH